MRRPSPPFCGAPTRAARGAAAGSVAETPGLRCARCAVPRAGADAPPRPITQPCLLQPEGPDSQVRAGHVPPVLPRVRQGHRLREGACSAGARGAARRPAALPNPRVGREGAGLRRSADSTPLACAEPLNCRAARAARAACGGARRAGGVARCWTLCANTTSVVLLPPCAPRSASPPRRAWCAPHAACERHITSAVRLGLGPCALPRPRRSDARLPCPADVARAVQQPVLLKVNNAAQCAPLAPQPHSTVTDFARLRGWSTLCPRNTVRW